MDNHFETVIGLEVHLHLRTQTKAFCGCANEFGKDPNALVCPVCLGFPGSLPVLNKTAFDYAIKVGLALNCQIQHFTKFDRKHYYYPDLPKNYQISQYDLPVALNGYIEIFVKDAHKKIGIRRVHLEEDAGKLIHQHDKSRVDFNRAGVPLLEIVTQPDLSSAEEAYEYLTDLKAAIEYLDVSDCDMEKGSLRCDANISIRKAGDKELGTKAEIKNMNSFKGVKDALTFEIGRQTAVLNSGERVVQETRLWDVKSQETVSMRSKEEAKDYRYFPEPDLPPFTITPEKIAEIKQTIPESPKEKKARFIKEFGLCDYDAKIMVSSRDAAEYSEVCLKQFPDKNKKPVANWIIGPMNSLAGSVHCSIGELGISPENLVSLIELVEIQQSISNLTGKSVLEKMYRTGKSPSQIIQEENLAQISDEGFAQQLISHVLAENQSSVQDYKSGKVNALMFLVGQAMKKSQGKVNPKVVQEILKRRLSDA